MVETKRKIGGIMDEDLKCYLMNPHTGTVKTREEWMGDWCSEDTTNTWKQWSKDFIEVKAFYVIEIRDGNGRWNSECIGDNNHFETPQEAEEAFDELVKSVWPELSEYKISEEWEEV